MKQFLSAIACLGLIAACSGEGTAPTEPTVSPPTTMDEQPLPRFTVEVTGSGPDSARG